MTETQSAKDIEVTFKFFLPEHSEEYHIFHHATEYYSALLDAYEKCRKIWKYTPECSEDLLKFAEEMGALIAETGVLDV